MLPLTVQQEEVLTVQNNTFDFGGHLLVSTDIEIKQNPVIAAGSEPW